MKILSLGFLLVALSVATANQCTTGPCCNLETLMFKSTGAECAPPSDPCQEILGTCSGFSAECAYKQKANGLSCGSDGEVCLHGKCVSVDTAKDILATRKQRQDKLDDDKITQTSNSAVRISGETKELHIKIGAELEKAKTLLNGVTLTDEKGVTALNTAKTSIDKSLKLHNTDNAEKLSLAASKIQAELKIAIAQLRAASAYCDSVQFELLEEALVVLEKVVTNVKTLKKDARANATGKDRRQQKEQAEREELEKINAKLPEITKSALEAADKLEERQREKLAKLVAERMINERLENERVIDAELKRITKKATAARRGSLRMFEKQEKNDEDAQEIKREAKRILETDKEMKMRYFVGLTKEILNSNRERFLAKDRKKVPNEEKYAEEFAREHEIVRRNEEALVNSGYFGEKYGRVNITLPTFTNDDDSSSSAAPSLKATLFGEDGNTPNIAAIACFAVAGVLVVVAIVAVIVKVARSGSDDSKAYKKDDDEDDTDAYENF